MVSNVKNHCFNAKLHSTDFDLRFNKGNGTRKSSKPNKQEKEKDSRAKKKSSVNVQCQECGQFYNKKIFDRHSNQCPLLQQCFKKDIWNERIPNANISPTRFVIRSVAQKTTIPRRKQGLLEQEHEIAWGQFEHTCSMPKALVRFEDIPFLPYQEGAIVGAFSDDSSPKENRARLRALLIRWHPDHFLQRFGTKLFPGDVPSIQSKLNATIRFLSYLKGSIK
jgi:hypothetical protein